MKDVQWETKACDDKICLPISYVDFTFYRLISINKRQLKISSNRVVIYPINRKSSKEYLSNISF